MNDGIRGVLRDFELADAEIERLTIENERLKAEIARKDAEIERLKAECDEAEQRYVDMLDQRDDARRELSRTTPKPMTAAEVCNVLNRDETQPDWWEEDEGRLALMRHLGPGMRERLAVLSLRDAQYIAQGLLRDAGPTSPPLEASMRTRTQTR